MSDVEKNRKIELILRPAKWLDQQQGNRPERLTMVPQCQLLSGEPIELAQDHETPQDIELFVSVLQLLPR
jgi:hypothetical protein